MTISAKAIFDSYRKDTDTRLTTLELRYPRFIHAEFMTHRMFSRNASSSRAIPTPRLIRSLIDDPVYPTYWGQNQPGMQAREEMYAEDIARAKAAWDRARNNAIAAAETMNALGAHKQIVNRLLEPFGHITVVMTATEFENFYDLRLHPDAQPEIQALARAMWEAMDASAPFQSKPGLWHRPYVTDEDIDTITALSKTAWDRNDNLVRDQFVDVFEYQTSMMLRVSAARCARVSYKTHEGNTPEVKDDLELAEKLRNGGHWSPFEHQAVPMFTTDADRFYYNLKNYASYRFILDMNREKQIRAALAEKQRREASGEGTVQ